ncbi:Gfo/Idh/MocA family protein [Agathobaculum sp.]|uniref:Gfo/Idh/MocA family protein n=1 Tax=Agathobaculum sp. TaxID=2048138 RepID=UPI002A838871|nr:Gfo/Idh/MocA family oxidoreductase [Agathobaculum sp.]MDY3618235.1 Gfo/Idh/MocA family oxidoreductase [Agathobaculum sp.]
MDFAIIGCGRIADNHLDAALQNGMRVSALCDISRDSIARVSEKFGLSGAVHYTDYRQMLAENPPDLVTVATGSGMHAQMTLDCLEAGCHVIVEKPMALSLADADRMIALAEKKHLQLCVCQQNRFNKAVQRIRRAVEDGSFGRLYHGTAHVRWHRDTAYYDSAAWRGTWEADGGCLLNQCIHTIDLLRWMLGDEVDEVVGLTANLAHPNIETEDVGLAMVRFRNGALGLIEGTVNVYPENLEAALYLFGETGTVKAAGEAVNRLDIWRFADQDDAEEKAVRAQCSEEIDSVYGFGHVPLYADMKDAIETGRAPLVDGHAGRRALELVLAIYLSSRENRPVKLPLHDIGTLDFKK